MVTRILLPLQCGNQFSQCVQPKAVSCPAKYKSRIKHWPHSVHSQALPLENLLIPLALSLANRWAFLITAMSKGTNLLQGLILMFFSSPPLFIERCLAIFWGVSGTSFPLIGLVLCPCAISIFRGPSFSSIWRPTRRQEAGNGSPSSMSNRSWNPRLRLIALFREARKVITFPGSLI